MAGILRQGASAHVAVLVKDNHASKLAVRLAKALINPHAAHGQSRLTLVHVVGSEYAIATAEQKVLEPFNQEAEFKRCIHYKILVQREGMGLTDLVAEAITQLNPHLLVIGSQGLCNDMLTESENARHRDKPRQAVLGTTIRRKPSRLATAMRLAQALHQQVPLLLVKDTSVGAFSTNASPSLHCMIDLSATAREALDWLLGRLQPQRGDSLVLAVGRAFDNDNMVRQHAVRLLTTFGVQAAVSPAGAARKRLLREQSHKALPGAVAADEIDILMLNAPRSRDLSPTIMELLIRARTGILLWPPDRLADGTTLKPMHPLRAVLDDSLPPEARLVPEPAASAAIKLSAMTQQETLLGAGDGVWRSKGPRLSFREHFGDDQSGPAMLPLPGHTGALRRSLSDAARGAGVATSPFLRMERALQRSISTAAARAGSQSEHDDHNSADEQVACNDGNTPAGNAYDHDTVVYAADEDIFDTEPDRRTWPPRAGTVAAVMPMVLPPRSRYRMPTMGTLVEESELNREHSLEQPTALRKSSSGGSNRGKRASGHGQAPGPTSVLPALPSSPVNGSDKRSSGPERPRFITEFRHSGHSTASDSASSTGLPVLRSNSRRDSGTGDKRDHGVAGSSGSLANERKLAARPAMSPYTMLEKPALVRAAA